MVTHTLGTGTRTAVLLHGGGLSWWNYRAVAGLLAANGYRVVLPMRAARALVAPAVALSYPLVRHPWFSRAQFASLHLPEELYEPYYRDSCAISKRDMIAFMRANSSYRLRPELAGCGARATILVGGREPRVMVRSARALAEAMPDSTLVEHPGWRHGEASLWHPEVYLEALEGRP